MSESCGKCHTVPCLCDELERLEAKQGRPSPRTTLRTFLDKNWVRGVLLVPAPFVALWLSTVGATHLGHFVGTSIGLGMHEGWAYPPGYLDSWALGVACLMSPWWAPLLGKWSRTWVQSKPNRAK